REMAEENGRDPDSIAWSSAGPALAAKKETDYRRLLEKLASVTGQTPDRIETAYTDRKIPHGSGSKAAEDLAALQEAGCERYYLQAFGFEPADLDLIASAYRG